MGIDNTGNTVTVNGDSSVETDETFGLLVRPEAGSAGAIANAIRDATGVRLTRFPVDASQLARRTP